MRTVDWYDDATLTRQFLPWCADEDVADPVDLTPQVVGRFTARLIERQGARGPLSRSTIRSYVRPEFRSKTGGGGVESAVFEIKRGLSRGAKDSVA